MFGYRGTTVCVNKGFIFFSLDSPAFMYIYNWKKEKNVKKMLSNIDETLSLWFNTQINFVCSQYYKFENKILCNRFKELNGMIEYDWLNSSNITYKLKCKALFLTRGFHTLD